MREIGRTLAIVVAVLGLAAAGSAADLPKAPKTKFTNHDLRLASLAFDQRTLAGDYDRVGQHDPAWDAAAKVFLDRLAIRFADARYPDYYASDTDTSIPTMLALSDAASKAHCTDPMVMYGKAIILKDSGDLEAYQAALRKAAPLVMASKYAPYRKYNVLQHYVELPGIAGTPAEVKTWKTRMQAEWIKDLAAAPVNPLERRLKIDVIRVDFEKMPAVERATIVDGVDAVPTADPWVKHMLHGLHEIRLAWEARGGAWATQVANQGWQGFADHLQKARDALEAAYTLEPAYPEAANAMITVAMGQSDPTNVTRDWFDRAVAAQIDYMPAWKSYEWSIYPRWGGNHMMMYALGCEAMRTRRYDTAVPSFLLDVLSDIAHDLKTDYRFDLFAGVWPNVETVFDGYLQKPYPNMNVDWWKSRQAGFAYRCGKFDEAVKLLDAEKEKVCPDAIELFDTTLGELSDECHAMTSDVAADVKEAVAYQTGGDFIAAENAFIQLTHTIKPEHPAWAFVELQAYLCDTQASLAQGKKTDISLTRPNELICWRGDDKDWKTGPDGISFTATGEAKGWLTRAGAFPANARIEVEWQYSTPDPKRAPAFALIFQNVGIANGDGLAVVNYPVDQCVMIRTKKWQLTGGTAKGIDTTPDTWHTWVLERRGNTVSVTQDGKVILDKVTNDWITSGTPTVGIHANTPPSGGTIRVRKLSVEPLSAPASP